MATKGKIMKFVLFISVLLFSVLCIIPTMEGQEQPTLSLQQLPPEIHQHILTYLTSATTREEAVKNIKNFLITNTSSAQFLNDPKINKLLVEQLAQQFTKGNHLDVAIALNTPGAAKYIATTIKNKKDAKKLGIKLIEAVQNENNQIVNFFLKVHKHSKFSFINTHNILLHSALWKAVIANQEAIMKRLLAAGANINKKHKDGETVLMWAATHGKIKLVQQLLELGADINEPDSYGDTPLMGLVGRDHSLMLQQLFNAGADVNKQNLWGDTALMGAVRYGSVSLVKKFLKAGADVEKRDKDGRTALMYAVIYVNIRTGVLL